MNDCEHVDELLGAWLDGELSRSDAEALRSHLADCANCLEQIRQLEKLDTLMKSVLVPSEAEIAFPAFWRAVKQRIETPRPWAAAAAERVRAVLTGPALAWAVPAMIVLVIGILSLDTLWPGLRARSANNFAAVDSIDAHGRNVALLREDKTKTTVIWLYQEEDNETPEEPASGPTF